ncbi:hypothetical protein D0859_07979 [Hortaea werneckii]|uniref:Uncharacterized protein n=1 Tax=Hortaea werneckii TaxID=91943 RepID=A0A3M7IR17_HORWE|nr:hypothetical protein D0859_07979 [Hortaea werneckii]
MVATMGAEGGAPVSPSIRAVSLVKRLAENVVEVQNALEANKVLRRDLFNAQAACERLEKSNSSLKNARAMQKARVATLEQENGNLKNIKMDLEQKSERIKSLERDYHQLQELKTSLDNDHKVKVSGLKRERFGLKNANAKLEDDNVALDQKLRETGTRLVQAKEAAEIAEYEKVRMCRELEEERSKTSGWESKVDDLHQQLGVITELETELTSKTDRIATLEGQLLELRHDLEMAAEKEGAHAAASRKAPELEKDLSGLRTLLAAERATSQEALSEAKQSKELLECSKTQCLALEEAAQAREICILRERQYAIMCWWEQASIISEENEYELAWSLQVCTQHEQDAKESRRKITVEQEESAMTQLRLKDYQRWYGDICDDLKQAKKESLEQMEHQRRYLSTIGILERERNKLSRELANLEHDHQSLQDYSHKLEGDLRTLSSTTRALDEKIEQLRDAENEKATCDRITKQLTEQAANREIYMDRLRQALARKQVRKRYIGTGELTQAESDLYFDARDCCKSSPALEVRVHGCLLPSGFSISTAATVSSDPRSLGFLEEGHRIERENVQVLRDVSLVLTRHGGMQEAIQQWEEHEAAMQQDGEHEEHSKSSKCGQEGPGTSVKSKESTRLSLQGGKAHIDLADKPRREVGSEPTWKPQASTQHLPATASTPSKRRCEAESIVSQPEVTLSDPTSPISPREPTTSAPLPDTGRVTGPATQHTVGGNAAQPHPRELFPYPRFPQGSRDELRHDQSSRDPRNAQKRPREADRNGSADNRPPWNAPKRPRFSYPWK